ncbi:hypothetical protein FQA39_LY05623 [Lamprigera yunnana]|nr:hypothetical protein FQA39_LY05623 [Lamprigera yunnana]
MKLLILSLCFNLVSSILTVPNEKNSVKKCVQEIIKNAISFDTMVLYVYDKTFDDVLPDKMQNPFLTYDISKKMYTVSGYRSYNEIIILNIKSASFLKLYFNKMRKHILKFESSLKRRYLIISSSEEVAELKNIFLHFLDIDVDDVIVITNNFTSKKEAIKVFTWNPYHPSNKCGTIFNFKKEESCSSVKKIENRRKLKNFNKCNMTFGYDTNRRYERYCTEVAYLTRFFLELMHQALNVTIIPKKGSTGANMVLFQAKMPNNSLYTKVTDKFRVVSFYEGIDAILNQTALEHNSVFIIFDMLYELVQNSKPKLHIIVDSELIGAEQRAYLTKNESPFLHILNDIVSTFLESGLINLKQMEYKRYINIDVDDVIVITNNFTSKKEAIKVFTWNPYHPSNKCGTIFNFKKEESCSSVKKIENRRKLKNFNKCNMTFGYDTNRRYERYCTEVAYLTRFFLELMHQALNVTIIPKKGSTGANMVLFQAKMPNNSLYTKVTDKFRVVSFYEGIDAILNQTALEHNSVFIIFDMLYELVQNSKPKLHIIVDSELIGAEQRAYLTKNESPFLHILNDIVSTFLESGLINLKQMEYKRYISKFAHHYDNKLNTTEGNVVLSLNHVYPVFVFWVLGLTTAIVVFIIEVLTHFISKKYC